MGQHTGLEVRLELSKNLFSVFVCNSHLFLKWNSFQDKFKGISTRTKTHIEFSTTLLRVQLSRLVCDSSLEPCRASFSRGTEALVRTYFSNSARCEAQVRASRFTAPRSTWLGGFALPVSTDSTRGPILHVLRQPPKKPKQLSQKRFSLSGFLAFCCFPLCPITSNVAAEPHFPRGAHAVSFCNDHTYSLSTRLMWSARACSIISTCCVPPTRIAVSPGHAQLPAERCRVAVYSDCSHGQLRAKIISDFRYTRIQGNIGKFPKCFSLEIPEKQTLFPKLRWALW
jgi:hypothetical protein